MLLKGTCLVLVSRVTGHLHAEFRLVSTKELVEVSPSLWPTRNPSETPTIELARETGEFAGLEVLWQDFVGKSLLLVDNEAISVREPANDISVGIIGQDIHQLENDTKRYDVRRSS